MNHSSSGPSAAVPADQDEAVSLSRLGGGLRVVTENLPQSRSVAIGVWVGVGSRDEPAELAGASHFLEHLLFKGSPRRSARQIAEAMDAVGGELNAFTSREYTAFHARVPEWEQDLGLDILLDVLSEPAFSNDELDAERQVILEELAWSLDTPDDVVHGVLLRELFPGHSLGWEVLGSSETVRSLTGEQIRAFHDRWYRRSNMVVSVVGPVDHQRVVDHIERRLHGRGSGQAPVRQAPAPATGSLVETHRPIEQVHYAKGWRTPGLHSADRYSLAVATQLLGGGWSSRLFQEVRERRGLSYTVYASVGSFADSGTMSVYAASAPGRRQELATVIEDQLEDLVVNGPDERELEIARGGFEGSIVLGLEDTGSRMSRLATNVLLRDRVVAIDEYLDAVRAVEPGDVQRALGDVLASGPTTSVVGPV